jgi:hypothetical protein
VVLAKTGWTRSTRRSSTPRLVTWFTNNYPEFGVPDLLQFDLGSIVPMVVVMEEHVTKAQKTKLIRNARYDVSAAERHYNEMKRRYDVPASFRDRKRALLDLDEATECLQKAETKLADLLEKHS